MYCTQIPLGTSLSIPLMAQMEPWTLVIISLVAAGMGMGLVKMIDYLRRRDADKEAAAIIERAQVEATSRRKEAAVEAKEMALKEKEKLEERNSVIREELHQRERQLDKSEDLLLQRSKQLEKQEKMVENNQRRLTEKIEDAKRYQQELDDLLDLERQTMHQLSGLGPEEAENRLLEMLEKELVREQGALILRYEKDIAEKCT